MYPFRSSPSQRRTRSISRRTRHGSPASSLDRHARILTTISVTPTHIRIRVHTRTSGRIADTGTGGARGGLVGLVCPFVQRNLSYLHTRLTTELSDPRPEIMLRFFEGRRRGASLFPSPSVSILVSIASGILHDLCMNTGNSGL